MEASLEAILLQCVYIHVIKCEKRFSERNMTNQNPRRKVPASVQSIILEEFDRNGRICASCGQEIKQTDWMHLDHILPVSRGGTNDPSNLRYVHASCNLSRNNRTDEEYAEIQSQFQASEGIDDFFLDDGRPDTLDYTYSLSTPQHTITRSRRALGFPYGLCWLASCTCGWKFDEPVSVEIFATIKCMLHELAVEQGDTLPSCLEEHAVRCAMIIAPDAYNMNDEKWIGRCVCGWYKIAFDKEDLDKACEAHWDSLR
jgi:hypothetical protein